MSVPTKDEEVRGQIQADIAALVESVRQLTRDTRSRLSGKVDKAEWYVWDRELAAEARGDVDYHLDKVLREARQRAVLARGASLPNLERKAREAIQRKEEREYGR